MLNVLKFNPNHDARGRFATAPGNKLVLTENLTARPDYGPNKANYGETFRIHNDMGVEVGVAYTHLDKYDNKPALYIDSLEIYPQHQGGKGTEAVVEVVQAAREHHRLAGNGEFKYVMADSISQQSLRMNMRALGKPLVMADDLRQYKLREALEQLPGKTRVGDNGSDDWIVEGSIFNAYALKGEPAMFAKVLKYNTNHDPATGRFSSGPGGAKSKPNPVSLSQIERMRALRRNPALDDADLPEGVKVIDREPDYTPDGHAAGPSVFNLFRRNMAGRKADISSSDLNTAGRVAATMPKKYKRIRGPQ